MQKRAQLPDDINALKALLLAQQDRTQALREARDTLEQDKHAGNADPQIVYVHNNQSDKTGGI